MANIDSKQEVLDYLSSGAVAHSLTIPYSQRHTVQNIETLKSSMISTSVDLSTVEFIRGKTIGNKQLYFVTFNDMNGLKFFHNFYLVQEGSKNWVIRGGGVGVYEALNDTTQGGAFQPKANLEVINGRNAFYVIGFIVNNKHFNVNKVQISDNNIILDDFVENDVTLFAGDKQLQTPLTLEFYNSNGMSLGSQVVL